MCPGTIKSTLKAANLAGHVCICIHVCFLCHYRYLSSLKRASALENNQFYRQNQTAAIDIVVRRK